MSRTNPLTRTVAAVALALGLMAGTAATAVAAPVAAARVDKTFTGLSFYIIGGTGTTEREAQAIAWQQAESAKASYQSATGQTCLDYRREERKNPVGYGQVLVNAYIYSSCG